MVNFPNSFDDDTTLYVAVNNLRTRLSESINDSVTTIPVITTSGYPTTGYISSLTGSDITRTEAMSYTNTTSTSFTGVVRGAGGTPAAEHNAGDNVDLTIVAAHHNELKDAILNLEHFVGVSGAENFLPVDDAGEVGWITALSGTFSESLTISGEPVSTGTGTIDHAVLENLDYASSGHTGFGSTVDTNALAASGVATDINVSTNASDISDLTTSGVATDDQVTANQAEFLSASGTLVTKTGDTMTGALVAPTVTVSESLTISGQPVATGTGGAAGTLQDAYDTGDGIITTAGGKPFELDGTGELTAVTGTFTTGITIGADATIIEDGRITTATGTFDDSLTVSGQGVLIASSNLTQPSLEIDADTVLTSDDTYVIVDGPTGEVGGPGFVPDAYSLRTGSQDTTGVISTAEQKLGAAGNWTLLAWVKPVSFGSGNRYSIFGNKNAVGGKSNKWLFFEPDESTPTADPFGCWIGNNSNADSQQWRWGLGVEGEWTLVGMTWENAPGPDGTIKFYQDGLEDSSPEQIGAPLSVQQDDAFDTKVRIGYVPDGTGAISFDGDIHSVALWDTTLNAATIAAIYNSGNGAAFDLNYDDGDYQSAPDLIHWWRIGFNADNLGEDLAASPGGDGKLDMDVFTLLDIDDRLASSPGTGAPVTVTLPAAASNDGLAITTVDKAGGAGTLGLEITIDTAGVDTIDGSATNTIDQARGSKTYMSDGVSNWATVAINDSQGGTHSRYTDAEAIAAISGTDFVFDDLTVTGVLTAVSGIYSDSLTISGEPVATGTGGGGVSDHSLLSNLDYASAGHTGFAQALAVKESDNDPTVSDVNTIIVDAGSLTDEGGGEVRLTTSGSVGEEIVVVTGTFTQSLTISGVPVSTGTGGGGAGTLTDINVTATGPSVTITGVGNIQTITEGNVITITGSASSEGFRGASITTSSGIDTADNVGLVIHWDTVIYDTDSFYSPANPDRLTIPAGVNKVQTIASVRWDDVDAEADGTSRLVYTIHWSEAAAVLGYYSLTGGPGVPTGETTEQTGQTTQSPVVDVSEGDYFDIRLRQQSGDALTLDTSLAGTNFFALEVKDPVATTPNEITAISGSFTQALNLPQYSSDPTSIDGDVWINTTTSGMRWQVDSTVFEILGDEV